MLKQILWTACVTPFNEDASKVDYQSLEKCLRMQEKSGNGILLLGSTGEGLSLTDQERCEIVNFACKLNLKTQLIAGVPSHNLNAALAWLEFCKDLPIQGYLMTTPIYTKPGVNGQIEWFKTLLNKSTKPVIIYDNPGRTAARFYPEVAKNLQNHPNFAAIKDSSGGVESIVEYKIAAPKIPIYCGDDYLMPALAHLGCFGLISVASNAWPEATRIYAEHLLKGNKLKSTIWWQACKALFSASNPIPIKALMHDLGIIEHPQPRLPLSLSDLPSRKTLLAHHESIANWNVENETRKV